MRILVVVCLAPEACGRVFGPSSQMKVAVPEAETFRFALVNHEGFKVAFVPLLSLVMLGGIRPAPLAARVVLGQTAAPGAWRTSTLEN